MLDPAGKSLYLQAWWYRGWSGLGPNAPIPLPIIPAFQDASCNNVLPSPQPWHWERGMSPVCGHPHQDRQALPALGTLATSIRAAPPCSDASSAPFQIQIWILHPVLKRSRQSSWAVRCFCPTQETESAAGGQCVCVVSHTSFLGGKC